MSSPFNEITTYLLSPVIVRGNAVILCRAGQGDQNFGEDYDTDYNVVANLTIGTIVIYTATEEVCLKISAYLIGLYGGDYIDEGVCLTWENPGF